MESGAFVVRYSVFLPRVGHGWIASGAGQAVVETRRHNIIIVDDVMKPHGIGFGMWGCKNDNNVVGMKVKANAQLPSDVEQRLKLLDDCTA